MNDSDKPRNNVNLRKKFFSSNSDELEEKGEVRAQIANHQYFTVVSSEEPMDTTWRYLALTGFRRNIEAGFLELRGIDEIIRIWASDTAKLRDFFKMHRIWLLEVGNYEGIEISKISIHSRENTSLR